MKPFTAKVIDLIQRIPEGRVMTYGQIAKLAGSPRGARQVVRILHSSSAKHRLPWHRIVNAKGEIAIKDEVSNQLQKLFLQGEGIRLDGDERVNLPAYQFWPEDS